MEPYQSLVNAIIIQSVKDYRKAIRFLKHHPHTPDLDNDPQQNALRDKVIKMRMNEVRLSAFSGQDGLRCSPPWMVRSC